MPSSRWMYAYRVFIEIPARRRPPLFSRNRSPVRASRSSALIFLYSASWAAVISSPSMPEWAFLHLYTQHPHGSRDQNCRTSPPRLAVQGFSTTTRHDLLFELFAVLSCGDNTDFTSHVRLNLFFVTVHETCSTPVGRRIPVQEAARVNAGDPDQAKHGHNPLLVTGDKDSRRTAPAPHPTVGHAGKGRLRLSCADDHGAPGRVCCAAFRPQPQRYGPYRMIGLVMLVARKGVCEPTDEVC